MSGPARFLITLLRAIDTDRRRGYQAAIERDRLRLRARILAARILEGKA